VAEKLSPLDDAMLKTDGNSAYNPKGKLEEV
jgi:hypothetical protein